MPYCHHVKHPDKAGGAHDEGGKYPGLAGALADPTETSPYLTIKGFKHIWRLIRVHRRQPKLTITTLERMHKEKKWVR